MKIEAYLKRRRDLVDRALASYFPEDERHPHRLAEAMRYSLLAGGKRIRPVLLLAAAEAVGGEAEPLLPFACAVEMIHTYSLVHDDLPAMDDDALRRGRPTNHIVFGEALAILAGDALLTEAFRVMAVVPSSVVRPARALAAVREIAEGSGARGMVAGQAADIEAEGKAADLPMVEYIHICKTGALILASIRSGALLAGAQRSDLRRLTRYGEFLGLAFQVADDILDLEGTVEKTGKQPGGDEARGKLTYPAVVGLGAAKEHARELLDQALESLRGLPEAAEPLRGIARYVVERACPKARGVRPAKSDARGPTRST